MNLPRQELTVLPADNPKKNVGWTIEETVGIVVVNTWAIKPWYKKMFYLRFWRDLRFKLFHKKVKKTTMGYLK